MKTFFSLILIIVPSIYFGYIGKPAEMGLAIIAGSIAGAFLNLDKFERFSGAGFEAELKKAVEEAYATIGNLKQVTKPIMMVTISNLTHANRLGGLDFKTKYEYIKGLEGISKSLELKDKDLVDTYDKFYRYHTWDLYREFIDNLSRETSKMNVIKELSELKDYSNDNFPNEEFIKKILETNGIEMSSELNMRFDKYILFLKRREIRDEFDYKEYV